MKVTLFSQILSLLDRSKFKKLVSEHQTDKHSKGINSWTHLVSMLFCHLGKADSVRDIATGLRSATGNLSHFGITKTPSKSSMSYLNKHRDWRLFKDYYFELLDKLEPSIAKRRAYAKGLKRKIFIMDSTVISLCLNLFDWAEFRQRKGGIKLHTVLDYDNSLPVYMHMTDAKSSDLTAAKEVLFPKGSVLVMDRAYVDFQWLNVLDSSGVFFVTRLKKGILTETLESYMVDDKKEYLLSDEDIKLTGLTGQKKYSKTLRAVKVYDPKNDKELIVLTNNLTWTAQTISDLYKARWDIEVFFKHIKQELKIKTFVGTSPNAVLIQVWTAMITILLLKYLQNKSTYPWYLSNLVCFLRLNLFVKIDLFQWLNYPFKPPQVKGYQLSLF